MTEPTNSGESVSVKGICVGCGRGLWNGPPPKEGLAISCCCGAMAPIISWSDGKTSWPVSVETAHFRGKIPHLEYYLGFTSLRSPEKDQITVVLASLGSYSYEQCEDSECRRKTGEYRKRIEQRLRERGE